jgi:hypothetical protein
LLCRFNDFGLLARTLIRGSSLSPLLLLLPRHRSFLPRDDYNSPEPLETLRNVIATKNGAMEEVNGALNPANACLEDMRWTVFTFEVERYFVF